MVGGEGDREEGGQVAAAEAAAAAPVVRAPAARAATAATAAVALAAAATAAVLLAACVQRPAAEREPGPPSLETLARSAGCRAEIVTRAAELSEGACRTGQGAYRLLTFATAAGERAWLTEAQAYGGRYLVGDRWVVIAQRPAALDALRTTLGGSVETVEAHHHAPHRPAVG